MKEENKTRNQIIIGVVAVLLLIIIVASTTYAYFNAKDSSAVQTVTTANLNIDYADTEGSLVRASGITPIVRENMLSEATKKTFTVENTGNEKMFVDISLDITKIEGLQRYDFMWSLYEGSTNVSNGDFLTIENNKKIVAPYQVFEVGQKKTYNLYIWIEETGLDQNAMKGKEFSATITATGTKYHTNPESDFEFIDGDLGRGVAGYLGTSKDVIIPPTIGGKPVTAIAGDAFKNKGLTSVVIPNSVKMIVSGAFGSNQLTSLFIPNSVTTISGDSFEGNGPFMDNKLTNVSIPNSITKIDIATFSNNKLTSIVIPNSVTNIDRGAFAGNQLTNVIIPNSVTTTNSAIFANNQLTSIVISNSMSTISPAMFQNNKLTNVVIPSSVDTIQSSAFADNQLTSIVIPSSVNMIFGGAFNNNPNLTEIIVEGKNSAADFYRLEEGWNGTCSNIIYRP